MKKTLKLFAFVLAASLNFSHAHAISPRTEYTINSGWQYRADDDRTAAKGWQNVNVPHTWNALDVDDDVSGYRRGPGWYRRNIHISALPAGKRVVLQFEAVASRADVWINGAYAGGHAGGYSAFNFDITDMLVPGDNLLEVRADNSHNPDIPPLSGDFNFFGGIYRDVRLIFTDAYRISPLHHASSGVYITTPEVSGEKALIHIRALLDNTTEENGRVTLRHEIVNAEGECVASSEKKAKLAAGASKEEVVMQVYMNDPHRWDVNDPYLYTVRTSLLDKKGRLLDEIVNPLGIRTFSVDPDKGFTLNGRELKLIGTNRHQDYHRLGNALPEELHIRDVESVKKMGGNFLRVSHYPQDPTVIATCDRLGLLTSIETPIVNAVTISKEFGDLCELMMVEMVLQNFNNPSVCIWAYMNEVMLRPPYRSKGPDRVDKGEYLKAVCEMAERCDSAAHRLDPYRLTLIPFHSYAAPYREAGIDRLADIIGVNLYFGWYRGTYNDLGPELDKFHADYPDKPIFITEYGADADNRLRSANPLSYDYTIDYSMLFHESYVPQIHERPFVMGATVWNLNDFHSEGRSDAVPHFNLKGLNTVDRRHKDQYHYYRAKLLSEPVLHICGSDRTFRSGMENEPGKCMEKVKVYTNASEVEMFLDGVSLGVQKADNAFATFCVPFHDGENRLEARAKVGDKPVSALYVTDYLLVPERLRNGSTDFREMSVLLGSNRTFDDPTTRTTWITDREYTEGSWGYIGGSSVTPKTNNGFRPSTDYAIELTELDPIYQTQRRGIEAFRADLPAGTYDVELHFAELTTDKERAALAYQLGNNVKAEAAVGRVFTVSLNGIPDPMSINVAAEVGRLRPMIRRYRVTINDEGLTVDFKSAESETMLSAIRIVKVF